MRARIALRKLKGHTGAFLTDEEVAAEADAFHAKKALPLEPEDVIKAISSCEEASYALLFELMCSRSLGNQHLHHGMRWV